MAQTSDRVASIAAKRISIQANDIALLSLTELGTLAADIRALAASALRQDETRGIKARIRKLLGRTA